MSEAAGEEERAGGYRIDVPDEQRGGSYANIVAVWHTAHEFTLDFAATQLAQHVDESDPESPVVVPCQVVSRVRIPVSVVFDILRALNDNMTRWENSFGEIPRPHRRDEPTPEH